MDATVIRPDVPRYSHAVSSPSQSQTSVFDPLKRVLLEMAQYSDLSALLPWLVTRLVDIGAESVTAAAVWDLASGDACGAHSDPGACIANDECLHLVASAMRSPDGSIITSNPDLERALGRLPLTALDSQFDIPIPEPLHGGDGRRWAALRLVHRHKLVGAMALFPQEDDPSTVEMVQLIANQLASAIANERAFEQIRRLQEQLESSHGMPRPAPGTAVVSEADIRRFERSNIAAALEATGGRVYGRGGAAELLGLKPTTLASRLKKLGLTTRT